MDPITAIALAAKLIALVASLVPQIEADVAAGKAIAGTTDRAALDAQISGLHADTLALTAQLDALKNA